MKRVLMTGGSGFIGYYLQRSLDAVEIVNLDLIEPDFKSESTYVKGDVRNTNDVDRSIINCDTIVHLAAIHHRVEVGS